MPKSSDRRQAAVLWARNGTGIDSQPTLDSPVQIRVRWDDADRLIKNRKGEEIQVNAELIVGQEIAVGSVMWLGTLADWIDSGEAGSSRLMEVVGYDSASDLKNRFTVRKVMLSFYKGSFTG